MMIKHTHSTNEKGPALARWTFSRIGADNVNPSGFFVSPENNVFALSYPHKDKARLCPLASGNILQGQELPEDVLKSRKDRPWHSAFPLQPCPAH